MMAKSRYDPRRHHRRSIRLKGYDYTRAGAYFVTIVTHNREPMFGDIVNGEMQLNAYGRVSTTMWQRIPRHFPHVRLDGWVVMPDHVHGIIVIGSRGDAFPAGPLGVPHSSSGETPSVAGAVHGECVAPTPPHGPVVGSLGAIVGNFKSVTTRRVNRIRKTPGAPVWQRNYYERIIRDAGELAHIRRYIETNPARWGTDG